MKWGSVNLRSACRQRQSILVRAFKWGSVIDQEFQHIPTLYDALSVVTLDASVSLNKGGGQEDSIGVPIPKHHRLNGSFHGLC